MSLLWIDGFEGYGTTTGSAPSPSGVMARRYPGIATESSIDIETGRLGGYCVQLNVNACILGTASINTNATIIVGVAFKLTNVYNGQRILYLFDGSTEGISLRIMSGGELAIYFGSSTQLEITSGLSLTTGVWYWLEIKVVVNDSTGSYDVRIGGTSILSDTGIDTQIGSNSYYDIVKLRGGTTQELDIFFDDLYIANGAGSVNNDFLGNVKVVAIFPEGDGNSEDCTPSGGTYNWECVDEVVSDDDTTYVESSTNGHKDTYAYQDIDVYNNIKGLQINTTVRETDATSYHVTTVIRSNSTDYDGTEHAIGTTGYIDKREIVEVDPATTAAWLYGDINLAEFGLKVVVP